MTKGSKGGSKAWKRAEEIVRMSYPDVSDDSDRFGALVKSIYKDVCRSDRYSCESLQKRTDGMRMSEILEKLNGN